jgi:non-specific serine/threonine protein kinase
LFFRNYYVEGRAWLEALIQREDAPRDSRYAMALSHVGVLCTGLGDFQTSVAFQEQATTLARALNEQRCLAHCVFALADTLDEMGDDARSAALFLEAEALLREVDEGGWLSFTLTNLAMQAHLRGETERGEQLASDALEISRRIGFTWGAAQALSRQGRFAYDAGDYARATALFQDSLVLWREAGDRWRVALTLSYLADMAVTSEQLERAARLLGAADALNERASGSLDLNDGTGWLRAREAAGERLGPATFERIWNEGRRLSWDEAIAEAVEPRDEPSPPTAGSNSTGRLSPREVEVLRLLVQGHTDREIAEALFISPRTAQGHVSSIFNKLGVNSRTAAATVALVDGLIDGPETHAP